MNAQFISDLHLTPERPAIARAFMAFMEEQAPAADALYILGDFFEYWIGDDAMEPFHYDIARVLKRYTNSGRQLFLMAGNRDFAIGKKFLQLSGAQWLKDPCIIDLNNQKVLLTHGDLLCTDDREYQKYRRVIRNPLVMALLRITPLAWRQKLAGQIRTSSKTAKTEKSLDIMDVNEQAVSAMMARYNVELMIHGHTHRPCEHKVALGKNEGRRIVLGDWEDFGWVLKVDGTFSLERFPISPCPEA